ncbi:MAG: SDR family oxidoreductase, partial [Alicyclobacillaceae bacterium]|nr:SDR family oxidoreductase [Alicyclobacillaceae bacterium]
GYKRPHMRRRGWGRIINVSGLAARTAGSVSAGARNVAVVHLTKTLANAWGKEGITVNAVYPAITWTERVEKRLRARPEFRDVPKDELLRKAGAHNAIGRLVTAEEIAYVVTFLASPLSAGITGEVIAVTGGAGNFVYY